MTLSAFFQANPKAALGLSGGVDSAYLLYAAHACGADVQPYFVKTAFQPAFELEDARRLCAQLGVSLCVIEVDILSCAAVTENTSARCYHCKRQIFSALAAQAARDGYFLLLDGTNASDDAADRAGMRALRELSVCSPLRECGLDKSTIRQLSRQAGLFTHDKPAYACLATRVPTGEPITAALLRATEEAESFLFSLGLRDLRVRVFHGAARIQVPRDALETVLAQRETIIDTLKKHYSAVLLDLEVRG